MADRGFRGPRMSKHWAAIGSAELHLVANSTGLLGVSNVEHPGETVLRMIGEYIVVPTAAPTAADAAILAFGIGVVSSDAAELGATALPDPNDEAEYPWLYWASHAFHFQDTSVDPSQAGGSIRKAFDVKSMRKVKPRESLVFVVQYTNIAGSPPMTIVSGVVRVLTAT